MPNAVRAPLSREVIAHAALGLLDSHGVSP